MTTLLHRSPPRRISLLDFRTATARDAGTEQPKQARSRWSKSCNIEFLHAPNGLTAPGARRSRALPQRISTTFVRLTVVGASSSAERPAQPAVAVLNATHDRRHRLTQRFSPRAVAPHLRKSGLDQSHGDANRDPERGRSSPRVDSRAGAPPAIWAGARRGLLWGYRDRGIDRGTSRRRDRNAGRRC
jgi:hypothetical protein